KLEWSSDFCSSDLPGVLREFLYLSENLVGIGELALAIAFDEPDLALLVHDERRPAVGVPVGPVDAVIPDDRALDVGQERIVADVHGLRPVLVAEGAVGADTQQDRKSTR